MASTSKLKPFYVVAAICQGETITYENDWIAADIDEQWRQVVSLVASGEWEDVVACYRVDPANRRCDDCLIALANAVDHHFWTVDENPDDKTRDWIEGITGDWAFETDAHRSRRIAEQRVDYAIDIARGK